MPSLSGLARLSRLLPSRRGDDAVLSLGVQARLAQPPRVQAQFEVLLRHLFDRLLNNEAFGEDAALRVTQLAYTIALPGVLISLFLFPAYHGLPPHPLERPFWAQAADHLFFVTYALVILGAAILFQWDLLFPDLLDLFVLSTLPITRARLLLGRVGALAVFLALVLLGTTGLSDAFFPAVADLRCGFFRHFAAHTLAVTAAGLFAVVLFVALGSILASLPGRRLYNILAPTVRTLSLLLLLTVLFLFPLTAHFLPTLLGQAPAAGFVLAYPPFWFLGLYHVLLYGSAAQPVFHQLARTGLLTVAALTVVAVATYPLAYIRRVRELIEGAPLARRRSPLLTVGQRLLHSTVLRSPRLRATFHFVAQTLPRLGRLHLYMAMYAGIGLALILSGVIGLLFSEGRIHLAIAPFGIRSAVPILAFWIVVGLRTALQSPLGRGGSWLFRTISGLPQLEDLRGPEIFVQLTAAVLTLLSVAILHLLSPPGLRTVPVTLAQAVLALGLSLTLTGLFFLPVRAIPFTASLAASTRDLPLTLVRYFVLFPAFVLTVVSFEPWVEASDAHLFLTSAVFAAAHILLRLARKLILKQRDPAAGDLFTILQLHED